MEKYYLVSARAQKIHNDKSQEYMLRDTVIPTLGGNFLMGNTKTKSQGDATLLRRHDVVLLKELQFSRIPSARLFSTVSTGYSNEINDEL